MPIVRSVAAALAFYGTFVVINAGAFVIAERGRDEPPPAATAADYCRLAGFILSGPLLWLIVVGIVLWARRCQQADDA